MSPQLHSTLEAVLRVYSGLFGDVASLAVEVERAALEEAASLRAQLAQARRDMQRLVSVNDDLQRRLVDAVDDKQVLLLRALGGPSRTRAHTRTTCPLPLSMFTPPVSFPLPSSHRAGRVPPIRGGACPPAVRPGRPYHCPRGGQCVPQPRQHQRRWRRPPGRHWHQRESILPPQGQGVVCTQGVTAVGSTPCPHRWHRPRRSSSSRRPPGPHLPLGCAPGPPGHPPVWRLGCGVRHWHWQHRRRVHLGSASRIPRPPRQGGRAAADRGTRGHGWGVRTGRQHRTRGPVAGPLGPCPRDGQVRVHSPTKGGRHAHLPWVESGHDAVGVCPRGEKGWAPRPLRSGRW
jgi:hypothetical protein